MSKFKTILVASLAVVAVAGLAIAKPQEGEVPTEDIGTVDNETDLASPVETENQHEATILVPQEKTKTKLNKTPRFKDLIFKPKPVFEELLSDAQKKILNVADRVFKLKYNYLPVKKIEVSKGDDSSEAVEVKAFELLSSVVGKAVRNALLCSTVKDGTSRYARQCSKEGMTIVTRDVFKGKSEEEETDPLCSPLDPETEKDKECKALEQSSKSANEKINYAGSALQCLMVLRSSAKSGNTLILPSNGDLDQAIVDKIWNINNPTKIIFSMIPYEFMRKRGLDRKMSQRIALALASKYGETNNYNILEVQWPEVSTKRLSIVQMAARFLKTGRLIARILTRWHTKKLVQLDKVHIIGFSVGAHLAGLVGYFVTEMNLEPIGRITGLDPLGWGFDEMDGMGVDPELELTKDDAKFVDVIHTSSPDPTFPFVHYGSNEKRGIVDFYPNNGRARYCSPTDGLCHHLYSVTLYLSSIAGKNFVACKCSSWDSLIIRGKCSPCPETANMGETVDKRQAKGVYFLATA